MLKKVYKKLSIELIKDSISPLDFYQHELTGAKLKSRSWNDGGLCPFHTDTKPGSFRVNIETGAYKCFSCGAAGSDIIAFTMNLHELSFTDALKKLSDDWGLA